MGVWLKLALNSLSNWGPVSISQVLRLQIRAPTPVYAVLRYIPGLQVFFASTAPTELDLWSLEFCVWVFLFYFVLFCFFEIGFYYAALTGFELCFCLHVASPLGFFPLPHSLPSFLSFSIHPSFLSSLLFLGIDSPSSVTHSGLKLMVWNCLSLLGLQACAIILNT